MATTTKKTIKTTSKKPAAAKKAEAPVSVTIPTYDELRRRQTKPLTVDQIAEFRAALEDKFVTLKCEPMAKAKYYYGFKLVSDGKTLGTLWGKQFACRFIVSPRTLSTFPEALQKDLTTKTVFRLVEKGTEFEHLEETPTEFALYEEQVYQVLATLLKKTTKKEDK